MNINGKIIRYIPKRKTLYILYKEQIYKVILKNSQIKNFQRYFLINIYVDIEIDENYRVTHFNSINFKDEIGYYDVNKIKNQIGEFLDQDKKKLFLDLELAMHPYHKMNNFTQEIIQAGYFLEDETGIVIKKDTYYIKPVLHSQITDRTIEFLNITQDEINTGLDFTDFYYDLKSIVEEYDPKIYVWGVNDFLSIDNFYKIHNLEPVTSRSNFVNLLQLYKNYHRLKNDIGLYSCYYNYSNIPLTQNHDALEDARLTREIYHYFKEEITKNKQTE